MVKPLLDDSATKTRTALADAGSVVSITTKDEAPAPALPARYRDMGPIASGGCGDVRRALDTQFERVVAIKILRWELVGSPEMRARFLVEAAVTAQLEHPGIVAVHERGELEDGRPWFTMKEVKGRTLRAVIEQVHRASGPDGMKAAPSGWTFRRLVDAFARTAQAVAFAHRHGVVHRDLKPDNIMVGDLGEVLVMDWGLAHRIGFADVVPPPAAPMLSDSASERLTRVGDVLGTPAYMPPEQARGQHDRHGPESDVYSLGAILYSLLAGRTPYAGGSLSILKQVTAGPPPPVVEAARGGPPVPAELVAICEKAMERAIEARYPDASALADDVVAWLDGARRREQAIAALETAAPLVPAGAALRSRAERLKQEAKALLDARRPFDPVDLKRPGWALEEEAAGLEVEAALREIEWLQAVHGALSFDPDLPEAHALLAAHYRDALVGAERAQRRADAARFEALLRAHDRGENAAFLRGEGALTVITDPPGATVHAARFVRRDRRLVAEETGELGATPLRAARIERGSYVLTLRAPGRHDVLLPVQGERGEHWHGRAPGELSARPIPLPRTGELGPDDVYVPAGWCWTGGDAEAPDSLPARRIWIEGFVIRRFPVTNREHLAFLNDLVASGREEEALRACPRHPLGVAGGRENGPIWERDATGQFVLGAAFHPDYPVVLVDWHAASAHAAWLSARTGEPWRLPDELEREKAARGVDGRAYPFGDHFDATWACVLDSHAGAPASADVASYPLDEGPYGVRGAAGNVRDWCENVWTNEGPTVRDGRLCRAPGAPDDPALRAVRGGAWKSTAGLSRSAVRFASRPDLGWTTTGLRLARSWPDGPQE